MDKFPTLVAECLECRKSLMIGLEWLTEECIKVIVELCPTCGGSSVSMSNKIYTAELLQWDLDFEQTKKEEKTMKVETPIAYVKGTGEQEQIMKMEDCRSFFQAAYKFTFDNCPNGRAKSLALTKIEEATMWAIKSIVFEGVEIEKGSV